MFKSTPSKNADKPLPTGDFSPPPPFSTGQQWDLAHFRQRYEGYISWVHEGASQNVYLEIASESVNRARGVVVARGWERYDFGGRCESIAIEITVELSTGRFVMLRIPKPAYRAYDGALLNPNFGFMAPDFRYIVNDLGQVPDQHEDFVFRSVPGPRAQPNEMHRAGMSSQLPTRAPGC